MTTATTATAGGLGDLTLTQLEDSFEARAPAFFARGGTFLAGNLQRFLGGRASARVLAGSARCRTGADTPSIADPDRYPFACIVSANVAGDGLTVGVTLGFVGLSVDDRCWRAANERISVTTASPALVPRQAALDPVNRIEGCA